MVIEITEPAWTEIVEHKGRVTGYTTDCIHKMEIPMTANASVSKLRGLRHEILCRLKSFCDLFNGEVGDIHFFHNVAQVYKCNTLNTLDKEQKILREGMKMFCPNGHNMHFSIDIDGDLDEEIDFEIVSVNMELNCEKDCFYNEYIYHFETDDSVTFGNTQT